jgi:hypothetical protein
MKQGKARGERKRAHANHTRDHDSDDSQNDDSGDGGGPSPSIIRIYAPPPPTLIIINTGMQGTDVNTTKMSLVISIQMKVSQNKYFVSYIAGG